MRLWNVWEAIPWPLRWVITHGAAFALGAVLL